MRTHVNVRGNACWNNLAARVNGDANLVRRGKHVTTTFLIADRQRRSSRQRRRGQDHRHQARPVHHAELFSFALRASRDAGRSCWSPKPIPGFTDIFALVKKKLLRIEGDLHPFMTQPALLQGRARAPRGGGAADERRASSRSSAATCISTCSASRTGSMSRKPAAAFRCSACTPRAPTARQYRGLLNDERITDELPRHRVRHAVARQVLAARRAGRTRSTASPRATTCA